MLRGLVVSDIIICLITATIFTCLPFRNIALTVSTHDLKHLLQQRILILDGAMGTMIQSYKLEEADYRGERFVNHSCDVKGNNDLLSLTQPKIISDIHRAYFEAGADIVETNTFNGTSIAMADYQMKELVYELNKQSVLVLLLMNLLQMNLTNHVLLLEY